MAAATPGKVGGLEPYCTDRDTGRKAWWRKERYDLRACVAEPQAQFQSSTSTLGHVQNLWAAGMTLRLINMTGHAAPPDLLISLSNICCLYFLTLTGAAEEDTAPVDPDTSIFFTAAPPAAHRSGFIKPAAAALILLLPLITNTSPGSIRTRSRLKQRAASSG